MTGWRHKRASDFELRVFAGLQALFWALAGSLLIARGWSQWAICAIWALSGAAAVSGLTIPTTVRWYHRIWMLGVLPLGWLVSHLLMALIYFGIVTPIGLWRRSQLGDPLQRAPDPEASSYWQKRHQENNLERYFRQF